MSYMPVKQDWWSQQAAVEVHKHGLSTGVLGEACCFQHCSHGMQQATEPAPSECCRGPAGSQM